MGNWIAGKDEAAYRYLPDSMEGFPDGDEFLGIIAEAGIRPLSCRPLSAGLVSIYLGEKPPPADGRVPAGAAEAARGAR